ncbi:MAG TPA: helix-turn-helix domain-containing protein [Armatimonadaceae bacterium]|nr:helix-turn-helix domain-containing protein [Armatimonadaceae bacterium]
MSAVLDTVTPSPSDARQAREGSEALARLVDTGATDVRLRAADDGSEIVLSASVARLLRDVLARLAQGEPVVLVPQKAELTTHQAADLLGVSRPHLIKLLETGQIAYRKVGVQRRIPLPDLLRYREANRAVRLKALEELQEQAQALDMGY